MVRTKIHYIWEQRLTAQIQLRSDPDDILRGPVMADEHTGTYILGLGRPDAGMGEGRTNSRSLGGRTGGRVTGPTRARTMY